MIHRRLRDELERVAGRYRSLKLWQGLAIAWLALAIVGGILWMLSPVMPVSVRPGAPLLLGVGFLLAGIVAWRSLVAARNQIWVARKVEEKYPELKSCLLAAIEQESEPGSGRFGYLQSHVISEALDHARSKSWADVVPRKRIAWAMASSVCSLVLWVAAMIALGTSASPQLAQASTVKPGSSLFELGKFGVVIDPGNAEVERGTSQMILARITGPIPTEASLTVTKPGQEAATLAMVRSLEDPVFATRLTDIREPLDYSVETGGLIKGPYHIGVFEFPRVEKADADLNYPSFTKLEPKLVQDVRTVTVVEGTKVVLTCTLNKSVVTAVLMEGETPAFEMAAVSGEKPAVRTTILAEKTRKFALNLVDDRGRKNKVAWNFTLNVVPNNPVTLKPVFPGKDMEVSPLEELDLSATAWDDFGVEKFGVNYSMAGQEPVDVVLGEQAKAREKHAMSHRVELEKLKAAPDDLVSYHWWAEDLDSEGKPRRIESDMYFAEVRKFDEIFREGEAQARNQQQQQQRQQQQSQNEQSAEQVAQLQKEVINAIWKLVRREQPGKVTEKFPEDVEGVREGQRSAMEKAAALGEKVTDPKSMEFAEKVVQQMEEVTKQLATAKEKTDPAPLKPALAAAQSAYQNLLKLRAREHQVSQQQQGQPGRSQSRSQQQRAQLQQLDLKKQENPYESQRTASENPQETPEQREDRQALNRLRELARRQHDLNERLKELSAALEEAKTEAEKEELKRQLKRLQEEQRQVVQDADELQSRMEQPENQERMAEQRQQLEQARDQAQRASQAIEQEMAGQAAASGTRAQKEFEDLREEFRRRSSNRFSEDVKQLSDAANELSEKQKEIAEQLGTQPKPGEEGPKSLADNENKDQTAEDLGRQRERLKTLQDRMRKTIEEAEQDEPLLTKRLYDAVRDVQDQNVEQALTASEQSLRRGFTDDAKQQERVAGEGIEKLNENIKSAAEAVLGDDTEALRRAREELQRLAQELNDEIARNDPNGEPQNQPGRQGQNQPGQNARAGQRTSDAPPGANTQVPSIPSFNDPNAQPMPGTETRPGQGTRPGEGQQQNPNEQRPGQRGQQQSQTGQPQDGQQPQPGQQGQQSQQSPMRDQQPGQQPGEQPGQQGQQPGQPGQQPGQGGQQPGQQRRQGQQPGQGQQSGPAGGRPGGGQGRPQQGQGQGGQPGEGQPQDGQRQPGQRNGQPRGPRSLDGTRERGEPNRGGGEFDGNRGGEFEPEQARERVRTSPITGDDFRNWSDRLRDVEEMVNDTELRAEAARIRERARGIRSEMKRHSEQPKWDLIRRQVAEPLASLRDRVNDEVIRRASKQAVVPLDRDPVPPEYAEKTRAYYERLGTGR